MSHLIVYSVIFAWSAWCVMSGEVKDGIVGKIMYSLLSIAALAAIINDKGLHATSDTTIMWCMAGIGIRHFILKSIKRGRIMASTKQPKPCNKKPPVPPKK